MFSKLDRSVGPTGTNNLSSPIPIVLYFQTWGFQKSRCNLLEMGDRNTSYFHSTTIVKRRKSRITALKIGNDDWCSDQDQLKQMIHGYFRNLYQDVGIVNEADDIMQFPRGSVLNEDQLLSLIQPITDEEVRKVIFSMDTFKSPGSDGFPAKFYQANWDIVGASVCDTVRPAFEQGKIDREMNETLLCIIPKVEQPERVNQFRPISLCNVIVKIITKLMVKRLRPFLNELISPTQSAFIPGRGCHDNVIVVQEVIHSFKKCKNKEGYFIMLLDLEKAYDRISWDFLRWVLKDMGLPSTWIFLIMSCVSET